MLVPVGTISSLKDGIWLILSTGTCSGGPGATNSRLAGFFDGVAVADRLRAKIWKNKILKIKFSLQWLVE